MKLPEACKVSINNNVGVSCRPLPAYEQSTVTTYAKSGEEVTFPVQDPRAQELNRIVDEVTSKPTASSGIEKYASAESVLKALYPEQSLVEADTMLGPFRHKYNVSDAAAVLSEMAYSSLEGIPASQSFDAFNQRQLAHNAGVADLVNLSREAMQMQPSKIDWSTRTELDRLSENVEDRRSESSFLNYVPAPIAQTMWTYQRALSQIRDALTRLYSNLLRSLR